MKFGGGKMGLPGGEGVDRALPVAEGRVRALKTPAVLEIHRAGDRKVYVEIVRLEGRRLQGDRWVRHALWRALL